MAVLSQKKILKLIEDEELSFTPDLDSLQLRTHAIDLRLGFTFLIPRTWKMTKNGRESIPILASGKNDERDMETVELEEGQYFEITPGEFVISNTMEKIKMPENIMAVLYPRSSLSRKGLSVSLTGIVDAGYEGNLIIPIENKTSQPVRLYPGERFCQLTLENVEGDFEKIDSRWKNMDVIVGILPEENENEIELVRKGSIRKLKKDYKLKIKK